MNNIEYPAYDKYLIIGAGSMGTEGAAAPPGIFFALPGPSLPPPGTCI